jgi:hypothetical protein
MTGRSCPGSSGNLLATLIVAFPRVLPPGGLDGSYFQPVLDLLKYQPSSLEPVPNVVLVEGKSDFYMLRYMNEIIGIDSPVKTVPGTGAGSLDTGLRSK